MLPSLASSKRVLRGPARCFTIETTRRRLARMIWFLTARPHLEPLDLVEVGRPGACRVERLAELAGAVFQVVHLAEQVGLLFTAEQRRVAADRVKG